MTRQYKINLIKSYFGMSTKKAGEYLKTCTDETIKLLESYYNTQGKYDD